MQNGDGQFDENMSRMKSGLKALYGSKLGKLLPVIAIAALVSTASAAIFVNYYASGTATAQTNNVTLVVGGDSVASCTGVTPCVHVTVTGGDYATIAANLGIETNNSPNPQPQTYFTNVLQLNNAGASARNVTTIITSATETGTFYGSLTVYICTDNPGHNDPASDANCTGSSITSNISSPVTIASGTALAATSKDFVALVGWAAASSSSLTFNLQFQWA